MEIKNIQKTERKNISIGIKTFLAYSKWMKENKVSPTALFNEAVKELIEKDKLIQENDA